MFSSQNYPGVKGLLPTIRAVFFRFDPEHWLNKRNVLITFFLQGGDGGGEEEGGFAIQWKLLCPSSSCPSCWSSRKKRLHTVRQGPQKADGVLCNKHLGLSSAGNSSRNPLTRFPITFLITTSILVVVHQAVTMWSFFVWGQNHTFVLKGNPPSGFGT